MCCTPKGKVVRIEEIPLGVCVCECVCGIVHGFSVRLRKERKNDPYCFSEQEQDALDNGEPHLRI